MNFELNNGYREKQSVKAGCFFTAIFLSAAIVIYNKIRNTDSVGFAYRVKERRILCTVIFY